VRLLLRFNPSELPVETAAAEEVLEEMAG